MWDIIEPHLIELIGAVVAAAITVASLAIRQYLGITIDAKHRDALHQALMSGAEAAVAEGFGAGIDLVKERAIEHARASVPDALKRLDPSGGVLARIATRYAQRALDQIIN